MNHLLRFKYTGDWKAFEHKASPDEKLDEIAKLMDYEIDKGISPFQTFHPIFEFRNDLVHAKPIKLEETFQYPIDKFLEADELPPLPISRWEKSLTPEAAQRFFEDTKLMILSLYSHAELGEDPFMDTFSRTRWEGTL